jgi:hypothetical protein
MGDTHLLFMTVFTDLIISPDCPNSCNMWYMNKDFQKVNRNVLHRATTVTNTPRREETLNTNMASVLSASGASRLRSS